MTDSRARKIRLTVLFALLALSFGLFALHERISAVLFKTDVGAASAFVPEPKRAASHLEVGHVFQAGLPSLGSVVLRFSPDRKLYATTSSGLQQIAETWDRLEWTTHLNSESESFPFGTMSLAFDGATAIYAAMAQSALMGSDRKLALARVDFAGRALWRKEIGEIPPYIEPALASGRSGEVYLVRPLGTLNYAISRFESDGTEKWTRKSGMGAMVSTLDVAFEPEAGHVQVLSAGAIHRYDSKGVELDRKNVVEGGVRSASLLPIPGGDVIVAGGAAPPGGGKTMAGTQELLVSRIAPDGTRVWKIRIGHSGSLRLARMKQGSGADSGAIYLVGSTQGAFPGVHSEGMQDGFVVRLKLDGSEASIGVVGTAADDEITDLRSDPSGNLALVGTTRGRFPGAADAESVSKPMKRFLAQAVFREGKPPERPAVYAETPVAEPPARMEYPSNTSILCSPPIPKKNSFGSLGLREGDVVTSIDDQKVCETDGTMKALESYGSTLGLRKIEVIRDGKAQVVTTFLLPPEIPAYQKEVEALAKGAPGAMSIEAVFEQGREAQRLLTMLLERDATLGGASAGGIQLKGFSTGMGDQMVHEGVDLSFFSDLARRRGGKADVEFFELFKNTTNEGGSLSHQMPVTDYGSCVLYEGGTLSRNYKAWAEYKKRHSGRYATQVDTFLAAAEQDLTAPGCVCDKDAKPVIAELSRFLTENPKAAIAPKVRETLRLLKSGGLKPSYQCTPG